MSARHDSHVIILLLFPGLAEDVAAPITGTAKRGRMQVWNAWSGLGRSAFIADGGPRDRDPKRILVTLVLGLGIACVAAMAGWVLIMAPEAILTGHGAEGIKGLGAAAVPLADFRVGGLEVTVVRLLVATGSDSLFLLAFVAVAAAVAGHDLKRYWTAAPRIRWRLIAGGLVLAMVVLAPAVAAERLLYSGADPLPVESISHHILGRLAYAASALLLIPAAAAEELFFRGWLLRQIATLSRRPAVMIGVTAFIFSALHLDFTADGFFTRALMGAGLCYMTLRLGGIEFAAGVHAANNILIVLFLQPLVLAPTAAQGGLTFGSLFEDFVLIAGYVVITEAVARVPALRRWLGVQAGEISADAALPAALG